MKGKNPGMKASYSNEDKRPLDAGPYRARATFAWQPKGKMEAELPDHALVAELYTFTPKAQGLLADAWQGALEGGVDFKVGKD